MLICGEDVGAAKTDKAEKLEVEVVDQAEVWKLLIGAGVGVGGAHPTGSRSSPGPSTDRSFAIARYMRQRPSPLTSSVVNRASPCASETRE